MNDLSIMTLGNDSNSVILSSIKSTRRPGAAAIRSTPRSTSLHTPNPLSTVNTHTHTHTLCVYKLFTRVYSRQTGKTMATLIHTLAQHMQACRDFICTHLENVAYPGTPKRLWISGRVARNAVAKSWQYKSMYAMTQTDTAHGGQLAVHKCYVKYKHVSYDTHLCALRHTRATPTLTPCATYMCMYSGKEEGARTGAGRACSRHHHRQQRSEGRSCR